VILIRFGGEANYIEVILTVGGGMRQPVPDETEMKEFALEQAWNGLRFAVLEYVRAVKRRYWR
jgi:hypothetical protein